MNATTVKDLPISGLIEASEPLLEAAWTQRRRGDELLVLGDLRCPMAAQMHVSQHGRDVVTRILTESERTGEPPMLVSLQPLRFLDTLSDSGILAHRNASRELRKIRAMYRDDASANLLLVVTPKGLHPTIWASAKQPNISRR